MFKYKTEAELTAMTVEQRDAYGVEKRTFEATQTADQIKTAIEEVKKAIPAIPAPEVTKASFNELTETVNQMKESNSSTIANQNPILKAVTENEDKIKASCKKGGGEHEFVVKANAVAGSVVGNPNAFDLPGIGQLATRRLTVYDMFQKIPVPRNANGVIRYVDWDDATKVRAAAIVAEAGIFPESTAKWATYTLSLVKIGDSIPMSEEFIYDNAQFAAELDSFLRVNVALKIDGDLITGTGATGNILGLNAQVPAFVPVASAITDANLYDLVIKVTESISKDFGSKYQPDVALMNVTDINKMRLKKDTHNNYVTPPFVTRDGAVVSGITIMECNAVVANTMILGDSRFGKIYEEPGVYVATNYDGSDFTSDMVTMKARKRLNLLIRTVDQTGWKKVTSISAALTTLATVPV